MAKLIDQELKYKGEKKCQSLLSGLWQSGCWCADGDRGENFLWE